MGYQNVTKPRFYVSILQYLAATGDLIFPEEGDDDGNWYKGQKPLADIVYLNPHRFASFENTCEQSIYHVYPFRSKAGAFPDLMSSDNSYVMMLNHNFGPNVLGWAGVMSSILTTDSHTNPEEGLPETISDIGHSESANMPYGNHLKNGFSIGLSGVAGGGGHQITNDTLRFFLKLQSGPAIDDNFLYNLGTLMFGTYYDMPIAPDLSLTLRRDYEHTNSITSYTGSSFSNTYANKPAAWTAGGTDKNLGERESARRTWQVFEHGAFEAYAPYFDPNSTDYPARDYGYIPRAAKSGRRAWDLSFSYMSDSDLWSSNESLTRDANWISSDLGYEDDDMVDPYTLQYDILTDNSFYAQVWHKTLNGTLPFVFQPDTRGSAAGYLDDGWQGTNADQFAICRFAENSLEVTRTAHNVYNVSVTIEECF